MNSQYHQDLVDADQLSQRVLGKILSHGYNLRPYPDRSFPGQEIYGVNPSDDEGVSRDLIIEKNERGKITHIELKGNGDDIAYFGRLAHHLRNVNDLQRRDGKSEFTLKMPFTWAALAARTQAKILQMNHTHGKGIEGKV